MENLDKVNQRIVYLMRGLPGCGKSYTARQLADATGVVCETDEYFRTQIDKNSRRADGDADPVIAARHWNFQRFQEAVRDGVSPIVVDRGNARSQETSKYARYAVNHGYSIALKEPTSEWWQEIRVLLKYKQHTREILYEWADRLAEMDRKTHGARASTIREWIDHWKWDLTVEEILECDPG